MNAPPFPLNPSIGERYLNWVWNGARWVCSQSRGTRVIIQSFGGAGGDFPYQPSPGLVTVVVETIGGGGGSGSVSSDDAGWLLTAPGGGSGTYARSALDASLVLGGVIVHVGLGGLGGLVGPGTAGPGEATTFGALVGAPGGGGGGNTLVAGGVATFGAIGQGGAGPGGTIGGKVVWHGSDGQVGQNTHYSTNPPAHIRIVGGRGGEMFGGASTVVCPYNSAVPGIAGDDHTGAGAAGAALNLFVGSAAGASGGVGLCIATEYCWADAADDCGCGDQSFGVNARVAVTHDGWQPHGGGRRSMGGFDEND